jgi:hypothetical protein
METTIKLQTQTKGELDKFRQSKGESYDEVVQTLIFIAKTCEKKPKLSQKVIKEIEEARARIKKGEFYTESEMRKRLGI